MENDINDEEEIIEERVVLNPYDVWIDIIGHLKMAYDAETDQAKKKELFTQLLQAQDRLNKLEEIYGASEKARLDNETKKEMNRLDNETKLKEAQLRKESDDEANKVKLKEIEQRKSTEELKAALDAADTAMDIMKVLGLGIGCCAIQGAIINCESEGIEPGRSTAFRFISNLGNKIIKF